MILLKIWGSLIAPKHTEKMFDISYLKKIAKFLELFKDEAIVLVHGTGNVGHWFVEQFWLTKSTYKKLRKNLDIYFAKIDTIFPGFKRVKARNVLKSKYKIWLRSKIICGWDATSKLEIISSDDIFSYFLHHTKTSKNYMLSDVDGVLNAKKHIIKKIDSPILQQIHFRKKKWDVTWSMGQKIHKLFKKYQSSSKEVRIVNWKKLGNLKKIIKTNHWIGTKIHII